MQGEQSDEDNQGDQGTQGDGCDEGDNGDHISGKQVMLPFHKQMGQVKIRPANLVHINRSAHSIFTIALCESRSNMHANAILMCLVVVYDADARYIK